MLVKLNYRIISIVIVLKYRYAIGLGIDRIRVQEEATGLKPEVDMSVVVEASKVQSLPGSACVFNTDTI